MSSVTLVQGAPATAVGRNEMPFGRDTRVVPTNIVLDMTSLIRQGSRSPHGKGTFGEEPPVSSDAAYYHYYLALVSADDRQL